MSASSTVARRAAIINPFLGAGTFLSRSAGALDIPFVADPILQAVPSRDPPSTTPRGTLRATLGIQCFATLPWLF